MSAAAAEPLSRVAVRRPAANKWLVAITVMFGAFMAVMDISVVNVAMPHMMGSFGRSMSEITWVATSYSIAEIILATMAGWWSTLLGRKRFYMISFGIFTIGSVLAGTAANFPQMLIYRTLQGIGGGALIPISQAILRETFPEEEQGMAMAIYGMGVVLAPAIGPIFGGWLTDHYGWPWIFFINVPVGAAGILMVSAFLDDPSYLKRGVQKIDWGGIALLTASLTLMQVVLERGQENDWFQSKWIVAGAAATAISLAGLIWREMRIPEPIVNFHLLRNVPLSVGSLMGLIFGIGLFGTTFVLPQFTQELLGYSAYDAGLVLFPRALTLFLFMPVVGWLYKHVDARITVAFGLGMLYWSFQGLSHLTLGIDFRHLAPMLLIMGAGMPFMFVTLTTVSLATIPREHMTEASSLYTLSRRIGGNIGYALVATIVANRKQYHRSHLVDTFSIYNSLFERRLDMLTGGLERAGMGAYQAAHAAMGILAREMGQQATMLAYNDVSKIMGWMFVAAAPLLIVLPSQRMMRGALAAKRERDGAGGGGH